MQAVIMAGGKGTRLSSITNNEIPKAMVKVNGKSILERQIEVLKKYGVDNIIMIVGHLKEAIIEYFGDGSKFGVSIDYIVEEQPLGTAGAFYYLKDKAEENFFLVFGDLILDMDFSRLLDFHINNNSLFTLVAHPNSHPFDSDLVITRDNIKLSKFDSKHNVRNYLYHNLVNAGIYCINKMAIEAVNELKKTDLEKEFIPSLLANDKEVYVYRTCEYIKDVGTVERLELAQKDLDNNIVQNKNLTNKQKAIFLDRDGTINVYKGFIKDYKDIELYQGVADAIKKINLSDYLVFIVSNQPVIARGEASVNDVEDMNAFIEMELGKEGAFIDDIIYCPHHPDKGFEGERIEYKIECDCRKPKIGMLKKLSNRYNIDLTKSYIIGDTTSDVLTGINAGCKTIKLNCGCRENKYDVKADKEVDDLVKAISYVLENNVN